MKFEVDLNRKDFSALYEIVNCNRFEVVLKSDPRVQEILRVDGAAEAYVQLQRISCALYQGMHERLAQ